MRDDVVAYGRRVMRPAADDPPVKPRGQKQPPRAGFTDLVRLTMTTTATSTILRAIQQRRAETSTPTRTHTHRGGAQPSPWLPGPTPTRDTQGHRTTLPCTLLVSCRRPAQGLV